MAATGRNRCKAARQHNLVNAKKELHQATSWSVLANDFIEADTGLAKSKKTHRPKTNGQNQMSSC
jgi:hypothetical protein